MQRSHLELLTKGVLQFAKRKEAEELQEIACEIEELQVHLSR